MNETTRLRELITHLLARREHSRFELYTKLKRHQFDSLLVEHIVKEFSEQGLQSDDRFTESYVFSRMNKGYGPIRIQAELNNRGISNELMEKYINCHSEIWYETAKNVHRKRFGHLPMQYKERLKQMNFLNYRGFTLEQINEVFNI